MILRKLTIRNLRCHEALIDIPIHNLTVFVGENDAGKTVILNALELLVGNKHPLPQDYRDINEDCKAESIVIAGTFALDGEDTLPDDFRSLDGRIFTVTKTYTTGTIKIEVLGRGYADARFNNFDAQSAAIQKELLASLELEPESNAASRRTQFEEAVSAGLLHKQPVTREVRFIELSEHMPRFEPVSSTYYKQPDVMVQGTLRTVVSACLNPPHPETGEPKLLPELVEIAEKVRAALDEKIAHIVETLKKTHPKVVSVLVSPSFDFANGVTATNLMIDIGNGPQLISAFGEGTKKKLWMCLLEWERQAQQEARRASVIRAYDEPDVNLDYAAERKLFSNIVDSVHSEGSRTQAIVCTHAVTLIDQAAPETINHVRVSDDGTRAVEYLKLRDEDSSKAFLVSIGQSLGIANSAIFFERAFILVEGETEYEALPILYHAIYKRNLSRDGIAIINLKTNGAWPSMLEFFKRFRSDVTVLLLDSDSNEPVSGARVTRERLEQIGYSPDFLDTNCLFIGTKEFEDAFLTSDIVSVLNAHWPKADETAWQDVEIDAFRASDRKFSKDILDLVRRKCSFDRRAYARKPDIGQLLAIECTRSGAIPSKIVETFNLVRSKLGYREDV